MKSLILVAAMLYLTGLLSACGTMAGIGKDVQSAGEKIEEAATKKK